MEGDKQPINMDDLVNNSVIEVNGNNYLVQRNEENGENELIGRGEKAIITYKLDGDFFREETENKFTFKGNRTAIYAYPQGVIRGEGDRYLRLDAMLRRYNL